MAMGEVGRVSLGAVLDSAPFTKGLNKLAGKAKATLGAVLSTAAVGAFSKKCLDLGSDLAEVQNVVDVTFRTMSDSVNQWAQSAAGTYGLSETMAKQYVGTFGSMAEAFGFTEKQALDMSETLTGLAGDVASFYNISQDEAYTKLKSVFSGETETLKDLGIVMTQSALDAYALANGFGKTTSAMTEMEKVSLRYAFVQDQLTNATGDFARTQDSWANQCRILSLQTQSAMAAVGQGLINLLTPAIKAINAMMGKIVQLANAFRSLTELVFGKTNSGGSSALSNDLSAASSAADNVGSSAGDTASNLDSAASSAKKLKRELLGFDQITKLSDTDDSTSSASPTSGGSIAASGIPAVDTNSLAQGSAAVDGLNSKFTKLLEDIRKAVNPTVASLKRLWNEGLADLGNFAWTALKDFYSHFLVPVGKWTFGEGIPRFVDALNTGLSKVNWSKINSGLANLWDALAPFAVHVGEGLLWLWEKVLVPLGTWAMNEVVPRFLETLTNVLNILNPVLEALKPLFDWFFESVLKPIAEWTADRFLDIWDGINGVLDKFGKWCKDHPTAIQNIVLAVGSFVATFVGALKIVGIIEKLKAGFTTLVNVFGSIKSIGGLISGVFGGMSLPVLGVVAAIAAAISIGVLLYKNWDTIKAKASELWSAVKEKFDAIKNAISDAIEGAKNAVKEKFDAIKTSASDAIEGAKTAVKEKFDAIKSSVKEKAESIKKTVGEKFGKVKDAMTSAMETAKKNVKTKLDNMKSAYQQNGGGIKGVVAASMQGIHDCYSSGYNTINKLTGGRLGDVVSAFKSKLGSAKSVVNDIMSSIKKTFTDKIDAAKDAVRSAIDRIKGFFKFKWSLPKLKLPHPYISGKFSLNPPSVPHFGIKWYRKAMDDPMLLDRATIFGASGNNLLGAGEAGPEVVGGAGALASMIQSAVKSGMAQMIQPPPLASVTSSSAARGEQDQISRMLTDLQSTDRDDRIIDLLLQIIKLLETLDIVRFDMEAMRKWIIKKTNANTRANGGKCELEV
ncbi:MAG: hypothetical protein Q4F79_13455 [Eubacteriales bacterium]|nr:hypothetical protein [Eubacteriales bacterium]